MLLVTVPFHCALSGRQLAAAEGRLAAAFGLRVERAVPWFDPDGSFDAGRGQYNALEVLRQLRGGGAPAADRLLAVTSVDLFIPVLTHVFGEAQLDGRAAVVSGHRLDPAAYGLPPDEALLGRRLEIEAVHEVGHTFGLYHCDAPACAMRGVTYAEEIDLKGPALCRECLGSLRGGPPARPQ